MADSTVTSTNRIDEDDDSGLKRSITGVQLFFYTLGDVLGSGIYVLIGLVAAAVGGAFWIAFAAGVTVAAITGSAYAELVTKYPQAAGSSLYVQKAFNNKALTFLVTVSFLSASFAATGSLATGFASYFAELWGGPPALLVSLVFVAALVVINFIGITESVVMNMLMTFVELSGLIIVMVIGVWYVAEGNADFGMLTDISVAGNPALAVLAGVALSFFAMTGFENTANVAEETIDPYKAFPRSLIGGMVVAGIVYVLVSMAAALTVPTDQLAEFRRRAARGGQAGHPAVLHGRHDDHLHRHRARRDHQHHPGHPRDAAAHPLRHGARGRRPRRLRQDPPDPPQPVGGPALQRPRGGWPARHRLRRHAAGGGLDLVNGSRS